MSINREELKTLVEANKSQREIAEHLGCSQTNVRHYLKKFELKTTKGPRGKLPKDFVRSRSCKCGQTDPNEFYGNKTKVCKKCHNDYNIERGRKNKLKGIEYLGGKCVSCGFNAYPSALEFHHVDPNKKDSFFRGHKSWSWEKLQKELDGCLLLCSNCHKGHHAGELELKKSP
jgi:hypothetical protein